ncbi:MAG TPA: efflux RND transporter permease subunit, partial [Rhodospirillales bacterium]|nr:efflux RND transporter permease subunit [Rhodospirillales bacterium]
NIYRLRQTGRPPFEAALEGARQVWAPILVSALTTVLVFVPILVMPLEVGQLFRDIAVAISVSVLLSLAVAMTVIPALSRRLLGATQAQPARQLPLLDPLARAFARLLTGFLRQVVGNRALALLLVAGVTLLAGGFTWRYLPQLDYLPEGNRNLVFGVILPPPGYNLDTMTGIAERIEAAARPLWESRGAAGNPDGPPRIANFFFVAVRGSAFLGASAVEPTRAGELVPVLRRPIFGEPGTYGFLTQPSIFGRGIGGGRSIDLDISGPDIERLLEVALRAAGLVGRVLPREAGNQLRPRPGLELGAPEVRLLPDRVRLADVGLSARDFAIALDAFNDGIRVDEIASGGERFDLVLRGPRDVADRTQDIAATPIVTPAGTILRAADLARVLVTAGPTRIRHIERRRTVTLEIRPAPTLPLEAALDLLRREVVAPLEAGGLPPGVTLDLAGTADKLSQTFDALAFDLLLAAIIVFLVMAVLFESFLYPLVVMVSVPLAAAGGVGGLWLLNRFTFQPLDMLTLLGFVILIGIVVNNAILLVDRALAYRRREGLRAEAAIMAAVGDRLRPIFMTTATSVFGMLPLVLFPGAGSELYRGLGSVVVGGLALSALLTLFLVPPLLAVLLVTEERWQPRGGRLAAGETAPAE